MKLWIRNQDRTALLQVKHIWINKIIQNDYNSNLTINGSSKVIGYSISSGNTPLGKYKTEERVLQVLDEIQNLLSGKVFVKKSKTDNELDVKPINRESIVYEMPEK